MSPIDTSFLIAGVLTAGAYFTGVNATETSIRTLARDLYERIDWDWATNNRATVANGWMPECGFLHYDWEGYNEAALLYVLGLGSPTHALSTGSYEAWTATYQWERIYGHDLLYAGPLFIHQFSHAWIDFRSIRDSFMREKCSDYFENSCRAVDVQREYARRDPHEYGYYGPDVWGLSAGDGPGCRTIRSPRPGTSFFRIHRPRRAIWAGRRNDRSRGSACIAPVCSGARPLRRASLFRTVPGVEGRVAAAERVQSDRARSGFAWMDL